ncbi:PREDICTED: mitochondrial ribosome-associated GTPase 1-like [Branchiostoma belcheri]|uniref:Mitochondrial GTPase 1 n=1 Tax=Branchiostoma belcheri TaxID=7741 RepID=A0A6P5A0G5_BRABE|nr:PREDICTED: mitochondrial ribosome-associated GTPase 1-like [Branchiostoma belcheri]
MASSRVASKFRTRFDYRGYEVAKWFPGHMAKGLNRMRRQLKGVDCVLEVHDARIPTSGRTPRFQETLSVRPHLLVLNKIDLADLSKKNDIEEKLRRQNVEHLTFSSCCSFKDQDVKHIMPKVMDILAASPGFYKEEDEDITLMVIGIPNVGKSSLINAFRRMYLKKGKATPVGKDPGITRSVLTRIRVSDRPSVFLLDTPGVLSPNIPDVETGFKLALVGAIKDHLVGEDFLADYLLYRLNREKNFRYVEHYKMQEPCDHVLKMLGHVAVQMGKTRKIRMDSGTGAVMVHQPNFQLAALQFLRDFRQGTLGPAMLD